MFRSLSGFKARYHYLTLVTVSEFDEWKVLLVGPNVTIHGSRQFGEQKAKEHALALAQNYIQERKHDELPVIPAVDWLATAPDDWLVWSA